MVKRVYVEKKPGFDVEAQQLLAELHLITLFPNLHVPPANALRAKENGC